MKRALWTYLLLAGSLIPFASQAVTLPRSGGKPWWDQVSCQCCNNIVDDKNNPYPNLQYGPKHVQGTQDNAGNGSYEIEAICNRYISSSSLNWDFRVKATMWYEAASGSAGEFVEIYLFNQDYSDEDLAYEIATQMWCNEDPFPGHSLVQETGVHYCNVTDASISGPSGMVPVTPPVMIRLFPDSLITQVDDASVPPPPEPTKQHPLTKHMETAKIDPAVLNRRIRIASPAEEEVVTGDEVLFRVVEASVKNSDGEWRFDQDECCVLELQYKADPDTAMNIPHLWVTVAEDEYLDHGETLVNGTTDNRNQMAEWALSAIEGSDFATRKVVTMLEHGGGAQGSWRWRAKVTLRDAASYNSLWRTFRIQDPGEMQNKRLADPEQPSRDGQTDRPTFGTKAEELKDRETASTGMAANLSPTIVSPQGVLRRLGNQLQLARADDPKGYQLQWQCKARPGAAGECHTQGLPRQMRGRGISFKFHDNVGPSSWVVKVCSQSDKNQCDSKQFRYEPSHHAKARGVPETENVTTDRPESVEEASTPDREESSGDRTESVKSKNKVPRLDAGDSQQNSRQ